jgi:signal peptidase I
MTSRLKEIIWMIAIMAIVFTGVQLSLQSFKVDGVSMEPSFQNSQYLIVDKLSYRFRTPERGDVVVFHNPQFPDELYIKRVVGLPGELVQIKEGRLYVDGVELRETPDLSLISNTENYSLTVGEDEYFVMGDNRSNSSGSHIFGAVPEEGIVGRVWIRYWPPSSWGLSPDYSAEMEPTEAASV